MTAPHATDSEMIRAVASQLVDTVFLKYQQQHPEKKKMDVPPPLKWAGAVFAALMTLSATGMLFWVISTLNTLQLTVARIDERQQSQLNDNSSRFRSLDDRVARVEEQIRRDADSAERRRSQ